MRLPRDSCYYALNQITMRVHTMAHHVSSRKTTEKLLSFAFFQAKLVLMLVHKLR